MAAPTVISPGSAGRSRTALTSLLAVVLVLLVTFLGTGRADATAYSGTLAPIAFGGALDMNGDGSGDASDNAQAFFGDTDILGGYIDCDGWGILAADVNAGSVGDGSIDASDVCVLRAYDGSADGLFIWVENGAMTWISDTFATPDKRAIPDGWPVPAIFTNVATPTSTSVAAADFAWQALAGKVDSNGSGAIDSDDCTIDVIGGIDVLGSALACAGTVSSIYNGYVDLNDDLLITASDTCVNGCFLGRNVTRGLVQLETPSLGTPGAQGIPGVNGVSGRTSVSVTSSSNSLDKGVTATCPSSKVVVGGGYRLSSPTPANLRSLVVTKNFASASDAWTARAVEGSPVAGNWSITVTAICATAA